eukprot:TRINITY_DN1121_c0_g2_i1.p1 TRINITY_DN1121_c0_g2~~TRINITY_DN1121_c0_g2_i1.p1  ORF type:complete len:902 (+),score=151.74 TRINITY_DN1121_c0_g2_i1:232-2937(+)
MVRPKKASKIRCCVCNEVRTACLHIRPATRAAVVRLHFNCDASDELCSYCWTKYSKASKGFTEAKRAAISAMSCDTRPLVVQRTANKAATAAIAKQKLKIQELENQLEEEKRLRARRQGRIKNRRHIMTLTNKKGHFTARALVGVGKLSGIHHLSIREVPSVIKAVAEMFNVKVLRLPHRETIRKAVKGLNGVHSMNFKKKIDRAASNSGFGVIVDVGGNAFHAVGRFPASTAGGEPEQLTLCASPIRNKTGAAQHQAFTNALVEAARADGFSEEQSTQYAKKVIAEHLLYLHGDKGGDNGTLVRLLNIGARTIKAQLQDAAHMTVNLTRVVNAVFVAVHDLRNNSMRNKASGYSCVELLCKTFSELWTEFMLPFRDLHLTADVRESFSLPKDLQRSDFNNTRFGIYDCGGHWIVKHLAEFLKFVALKKMPSALQLQEVLMSFREIYEDEVTLAQIIFADWMFINVHQPLMRRQGVNYKEEMEVLSRVYRNFDRMVEERFVCFWLKTRGLTILQVFASTACDLGLDPKADCYDRLEYCVEMIVNAAKACRRLLELHCSGYIRDDSGAILVPDERPSDVIMEMAPAGTYKAEQHVSSYNKLTRGLNRYQKWNAESRLKLRMDRNTPGALDGAEEHIRTQMRRTMKQRPVIKQREDDRRAFQVMDPIVLKAPLQLEGLPSEEARDAIHSATKLVLQMTLVKYKLRLWKEDWWLRVKPASSDRKDVLIRKVEEMVTLLDLCDLPDATERAQPAPSPLSPPLQQTTAASPVSAALPDMEQPAPSVTPTATVVLNPASIAAQPVSMRSVVMSSLPSASQAGLSKRARSVASAADEPPSTRARTEPHPLAVRVSSRERAANVRLRELSSDKHVNAAKRLRAGASDDLDLVLAPATGIAAPVDVRSVT